MSDQVIQIQLDKLMKAYDEFVKSGKYDALKGPEIILDRQMAILPSNEINPRQFTQNNDTSNTTINDLLAEFSLYAGCAEKNNPNFIKIPLVVFEI